jgi:hypothetical protein
MPMIGLEPKNQIGFPNCFLYKQKQSKTPRRDFTNRNQIHPEPQPRLPVDDINPLNLPDTKPGLNPAQPLHGHALPDTGQ